MAAFVFRGPTMSPTTIWRFEFAGWLLFTLSALAFIWSTAKAGDMVGVVASILFLLACFVFLVPVWLHRPKRQK